MIVKKAVGKSVPRYTAFFECQTSTNLLQAVASPRPTSTAKPRLGSAHRDSKAAAKNKGLGKDSGTSCNTREDPRGKTVKQNRAKDKNTEDSCDGSEESDKECAKVYFSLFFESCYKLLQAVASLKRHQTTSTTPTLLNVKTILLYAHNLSYLNRNLHTREYSLLQALTQRKYNTSV